MKKNTAFSLIELSIVILIIGLLVAAIAQGSQLIRQMKINTARGLTSSSHVASVPDLILWFETTREESLSQYLSDGSTVASWTSVNPQISLPKSLQAVTNPTFKADGIGGLPSIRFSNSHMLHRGFLLSADYTMFVVFSTNSITTTQDIFTIFDAAGVGAGIVFEVQPDSTFRFLHRSPVGNSGGESYLSASPNFLVAKKEYIMSQVRNNTSATNYTNVWLNNELWINNQPAAAPAFNVSDLTLCVGRLSAASATRNLDGLISEIIIYDRALKQNEIDEIEAYLAKKYSIKLIPN